MRQNYYYLLLLFCEARGKKVQKELPFSLKEALEADRCLRQRRQDSAVLCSAEENHWPREGVHLSPGKSALGNSWAQLTCSMKRRQSLKTWGRIRPYRWCRSPRWSRGLSRPRCQGPRPIIWPKIQMDQCEFCFTPCFAEGLTKLCFSNGEPWVIVWVDATVIVNLSYSLQRKTELDSHWIASSLLDCWSFWLAANVDLREWVDYADGEKKESLFPFQQLTNPPCYSW